MRKIKEQAKREYSKKNSSVLDLNLDDFGLESSVWASPQQFGPKAEKWFVKHLGWKSVPKRLARGDLKTPSGLYIELKTNIRGDVGPGGLQHRMWQEIDYYLYLHIDTHDVENITANLYLLRHDEVVVEIQLTNAGPSHGTKEANNSNKHIEYSISNKYNSEDHLRWKQQYGSTLDNLKAL